MDVRDNVGKWMELVAASGVPVTTLEALKHGFNIETIGTMQTSLRTEQDLEDFMSGLLFQPGGPMPCVTGRMAGKRIYFRINFESPAGGLQ